MDRIHSTLIRIVKQEGGVVHAIIAGWKSGEIVRFPLDKIPSELHSHVRPDARFFAKVNIGVEGEEDLLLEDFEIPLEPDPEDGLA